MRQFRCSFAGHGQESFLSSRVRNYRAPAWNGNYNKASSFGIIPLSFLERTMSSTLWKTMSSTLGVSHPNCADHKELWAKRNLEGDFSGSGGMFELQTLSPAPAYPPHASYICVYIHIFINLKFVMLFICCCFQKDL